MKTTSCYKCGKESDEVLYGYHICSGCKKDLGLFTDITIAKQNKEFTPNERAKTYEEEIEFRLQFIEKDYISKYIKLKHIKEVLQ